MTLSNYLKSSQISAKPGPKQHSFSMCILQSQWAYGFRFIQFILSLSTSFFVARVGLKLIFEVPKNKRTFPRKRKLFLAIFQWRCIFGKEENDSTSSECYCRAVRPDLAKFCCFGKKNYSLWKIFGMLLVWYLANFCTCFGIFMLPGKFSMIQMFNDWKII